MSWPTNPWNTAIALSHGDSNPYTPEQWAAMQHQKWQQWAQWQQQYAQWQSQYGDKYTAQVQGFPAMGSMPPLPHSTVPPAPPPPEKPPLPEKPPPPPPPPHENNQPLFGKNNQTHATNSVQENAGPTYQPKDTTLNQNTAYITSDPVASESISEAEKKLDEEERHFDIQFLKWEEEIEKWRNENKNHPDKKAYRDYELKFETCRAQLLERRRQMKEKRSRLTSNSQTNTHTTGNQNKTSVTPSINEYLNDIETFTMSTVNKTSEENSIMLDHSHASKPYSRNEIIGPQNQDKNIYSDDKKSFGSTSSFLPSNNSNKGIPGLDLVPQSVNDSKKQDVKESKNNTQPDYSKISKGIDDILGDEKIMSIISMVQSNNVAANNINSNLTANMLMYAANNMNYMVNQNYQGYNYGNFQANNQNYQKVDQSYPANNMNYHGNSQNYASNHQNVAQNDQNVPGISNTPGNNSNILGNITNVPGNIPNVPGNIQNAQGNMQNFQMNTQNAHGNNQNVPGYNFQEKYGSLPQNGSYQGNRQGNQTGNQNYNDPQRKLVNNRQDFDYQEQNRGGNYPQNRGYQDQYYNQTGTYGRSEGRFDNPPRPLMENMLDKPPLKDTPRQQNINNYRGSNDRRYENQPVEGQPLESKWASEPMFTPSVILEYDHLPLRLKARDFVVPVNTYEYNHTSKDGDDSCKIVDFQKEAEDLFKKKPKRTDMDQRVLYDRGDIHFRGYERRIPREEIPKDDHPPQIPLRDEIVQRKMDRRPDDRYDDRRRDDRDRYKRDDYRDRYRERERERDSYAYRERRDSRRDEGRNRSRSREKDRKRAHSKDSDTSNNSMNKKSKEAYGDSQPSESKHIVMIDDILEMPGREMRPQKIVIILRGPPGSGKSYLAKLIRDKEAEHGGTARIMSIDDYFMQEGEVEERDLATGKMIKKPTLKYEYDASLEESYITSLKRAFKRSMTDGYFPFLIYEAVNDQLKNYAEIWNFARQNGFQVYVCTMELDPKVCYKRNIHNRTLEDIESICARFFPTPSHHIQLDPTTLLQNAAIPEVHMEDAEEVIVEDVEDTEVETVFTSRWEKMDDAAQLARLDGISKPLRPSNISMEDYLQLDDWKPNTAKPGKKTVRWADIEERREQEKMRAIGFVVGQTDWNRMTDPTMGSSALTQTKYIERVRRN